MNVWVMWVFALGLGETLPKAPLLEEVAKTAGLNFRHFNGKTGELHLPEIMGSGVALLDYDGDGDLDVFLVQGAPYRKAAKPPLEPIPPSLSDRLFRNELKEKGRLVFTDVTQQAGIAERRFGMGVTAGDVDNDGDVDLYVTNLDGNTFWQNQGKGTFKDKTQEAGLALEALSSSCLLVDIDLDGFLDLYVANYVHFDETKPPPCFAPTSAKDYCGPSAFQSQADAAFLNLGNGTFRDVSAMLNGVTTGAGLGVGLLDADRDGKIDIYVANDGGANHLWRNKGGGQLEEIALMSGAALDGTGVPEASMGVAVGDVDGDGDEDVFLTHLEGETNTLYVNQGGFFDDGTNPAGLGLLSLPLTGFGTRFIDFQNDGLLDLFVLNGAVRNLPEQLGQPAPHRQANQLYLNLGGGRFGHFSGLAGASFNEPGVGRGAATGDLDEDGAVDLVTTENNGPARLFLNKAAKTAHWLGVDVRDASGKRQAQGALVEVVLDSKKPPLTRRIDTSGSYLSSSDGRVVFGLGGHTSYQRITVTWPDGVTRHFEPGPVDRYLRLTPKEP